MLQFLQVLPMTCEYNSYTTVSWFMIYAVIAKPAHVHFCSNTFFIFCYQPFESETQQVSAAERHATCGMVGDKQYEQQAPNDKRRILCLMRHEQSRGAAEFLH
jgi:hypothetical protein